MLEREEGGGRVEEKERKKGVEEGGRRARGGKGKGSRAKLFEGMENFFFRSEAPPNLSARAKKNS